MNKKKQLVSLDEDSQQMLELLSQKYDNKSLCVERAIKELYKKFNPNVEIENLRKEIKAKKNNYLEEVQDIKNKIIEMEYFKEHQAELSKIEKEEIDKKSKHIAYMLNNEF